MNVKEIGERLVALCRERENLQAIDELYADDVESVEAMDPPDGSDRSVRGIEAVRGRNEWWTENHEIHDSSVEGPFPHGDDRFGVIFTFDVTNKPSGQRMNMKELAIYTLANGKIAKEEFFYAMG